MTKSTKLRSQDPFLDRERERYDDPLPSREFILQTLVEAGEPLDERQLGKMLGIRRGEAESFGRRLAAMARQGQILYNRKGAILVARKVDLVAGRVAGHPDGFGFVIPDEGGEDYYLNAREMRKVLHGDRVMVRQTGVDRRGRREAEIVDVIERAHTTLVGKLQIEHDFSYVTPSDRKISLRVAVPRGEERGASSGEIVVVEIVAQPDANRPPVGRVTEVLGQATDPGMEIEIALRKHSLPFEFSEKARAQAAKIAPTVRKQDLAGRVDLRDMPLVTIDGETARDFDDAVWAEKSGRGFRLVVVIADVSHYVRPGDPLDEDARERGTSVYFPRRVIPMLPEKLSNGLCSLNPDVERLCMVCDMSVSATGEIKRYKFYPAVMLSRARLTYTRVWEVLSKPDGEVARDLGDIVPRLQVLHELFEVLLKARHRRGAIDFETVETQIVFDDKGKIDRIVPVVRNDAHRLIEECMLAANVCASDFLHEAEHPALYRVHQGPTPIKLAALREFLAEFGLHLQGGEEPGAKDYARLLDSIKDRPDIQLLQTVLLRSLQQAQYSPENVGHFGLAYESYTHFTSPIRRYPDLVIHRAIKAVLNGERYKPGDWKDLGAHCSQVERRADEATREVESWLKCYYMRNRVGDEFDGVVSGVAGFGMFVALDGVYVEGMVHISELGSDYFHFDAARHQLLGERTGRRYRLADRVRVRLVRVDLETSRLEFVLAESASVAGGEGDGARKPSSRKPEGRKVEDRKSELRKPDSGRSDSRKTGSRKAEVRKPEVRKAEQPKPEPRKAVVREPLPETREKRRVAEDAESSLPAVLRRRRSS
jgi:ribonuclease R